MKGAYPPPTLLLDIQLCAVPHATSVETRDLAIQEILWDFRDSPVSWIDHIDWAAFTELAASFPHLTRIRVKVYEATKQSEAYMEVVHPHLQTLSQKRGVELEVSSC